MIENFPEFKKSERNTTKHFNLLEQLKRQVESRNLYKVSEVEQDLVSSSEIAAKNQLQQKVFALLDDAESSIPKGEKLRLALLTMLRFE